MKQEKHKKRGLDKKKSQLQPQRTKLRVNSTKRVGLPIEIQWNQDREYEKISGHSLQALYILPVF